MLNRLRWQLTLLYLLAAIGLVLLIGAGSYALLKYYFVSEIDQALDYKMAQLFAVYNLALPGELSDARQAWTAPSSATPLVTPPVTAPAAPRSEDSEEEDESGAVEATVAVSDEGKHDDSAHEDPYDASLAPIFILPVQGGNALGSLPTTAPPPIQTDQESLQAALSSGSDRRNVRLPDGTQVRLLSYRTGSSGNAPAVLQMGRLLGDQERVLNQFLTGLLILGGISTVLLGVGSWWLSGRSIRPAQKAWDQQQVFVSNASHELRTPLTLIRATAEYGLRSHPPAAQAEILTDILQEDDYMNHLVDDLLLLSRLDTHRLELKRERIDLPALLAETCRQVEKVTAEKSVQLIQGNFQGFVVGDSARIRQVLLILLDNALRFTPPGGSIHVDTLPRDKFHQIRIADTGSGIPAEHLPHIFERFYQVPRPDGDDTRSNGLGLAIAKSLIENQDGSMAIESQVSKGTTVSILLPAG